MHRPLGLNVRRPISLTGALLLTLTLPLAMAAQEPSSSPAPQSPVPSTATDPAAWPAAVSSPPPDVAGSPAPVAVPGRLQKAQYPKAGLGLVVNDIVEGGPGYIAVGGGTPDGLDHRALVWLSEDGLSWEDVPLRGKAAEGTMHGVAALPGGGFVAVGGDFKPPSERAEMVRAFVWHSADGRKWKRVPLGKMAKRSLMWDVTSTPDGVAAAGCLAGFHCDIGRVWTSPDGLAWDLTDGIVMAPYVIAANGEGNLVVGGEDDAYDLVNSRATVASGVDDWTARVLATPESTIDGLTAYRDGLLAVGTLWSTEDRSTPSSALQSSADGSDWELLQPVRLAGIATHDISAQGDLVALVGMEKDAKDRFTPLVLWARDLETFESLELPVEAKPNQADPSGIQLTDAGSTIFVFGAEKGRPMIWLSTVE